MSLLLMGNKRNSVHCVTEPADRAFNSVACNNDQPQIKMQRNNVEILPDLVRDTVCGGSPQRCREAPQLGLQAGQTSIFLQHRVPCLMAIGASPTNSNIQQSRAADDSSVLLTPPPSSPEGYNRITSNPNPNSHANSTATNLGRVLQVQLVSDNNRRNSASSINSDLKLLGDCFRHGQNVCQQDLVAWHSGGSNSSSSSSGGSCCSGGLLSCASRENEGKLIRVEPLYENTNNWRNTTTSSSRRHCHDLTRNCENSSPRCGRVERLFWPSHCDTKDVEGLRDNYMDLLKCGFYHGSMAMPDAKKKLKRTITGTFLLRDSSDPKFLYSLSVKTDRGTTSVRIVYGSGKFRLDCDNSSLNRMPSFSRILQLIEHYVEEGKGAITQTAGGGGSSRKASQKKSVWLESSGRKDTPVYLRKPCANSVLSLKHLCRTAVNGLRCDVTPANHKYSLELHSARLPDQLRQYMSQYPYRI